MNKCPYSCHLLQTVPYGIELFVTSVSVIALTNMVFTP